MLLNKGTNLGAPLIGYSHQVSYPQVSYTSLPSPYIHITLKEPPAGPKTCRVKRGGTMDTWRCLAGPRQGAGRARLRQQQARAAPLLQQQRRWGARPRQDARRAVEGRTRQCGGDRTDDRAFGLHDRHRGGATERSGGLDLMRSGKPHHNHPLTPIGPPYTCIFPPTALK